MGPAGDLRGKGRAAVLSGWLAVAAGTGEQAKEVEADLVPDDAGERAAAPGDPTAGAALTCWGGLVLCQDPSQCVDGAGVVTGSLQFGECVPHRADELTSGGVVGQPGRGPGRQVQRRAHPGRRRGRGRRVGGDCCRHQHPPSGQACWVRIRCASSVTSSSLAALSPRSALARKYSCSALAAASALITGSWTGGLITTWPRQVGRAADPAGVARSPRSPVRSHSRCFHAWSLPTSLRCGGRRPQGGLEVVARPRPPSVLGWWSAGTRTLRRSTRG